MRNFNINLILDRMQSKELEKEILEIKTSAEEIGIYLKGSTGQKSHLSEYEWLLVRTNL